MNRLKYTLTIAVSWILALALTSVAVKLVGDSPMHVLKVLASSSFGSLENFSYTLFFAVPMLLTGAAVALALEAGMFNIGAEGQLYMGAVCAAAWGMAANKLISPDLAGLHFVNAIIIVVGALAAFAGGAAWGAIAGYLRTKRGVHEVIATIMLNFIAMALVNWAILGPLKNPETQNLETVPLAPALRIPRLWQQTTWGFPMALLLAMLVLLAVRHTWWGFRVRATGQNEAAASKAGIAVTRTAFLTMAFSGGIAGLVGFNEVFLNSYRLLDGFSSGYGFTGLAIALLARGSPLGLALSALLLAGLHKGALDLDLETEKVTRDLSAVIQALILLALAAQPKISSMLDRLLRRAS